MYSYTLEDTIPTVEYKEVLYSEEVSILSINISEEESRSPEVPMIQILIYIDLMVTHK